MIQIACACGKTLSAKPELAGKRVKCPKCAAVLTVPVPAVEPPPAAVADANPFEFGGDDAAPTPRVSQRGLHEARRLLKYWQKRNGTGSAAVPGARVTHRVPDGLEELGTPEAAYRVGAVASNASQMKFVCGVIAFIALCAAGFIFGLKEFREDYLFAGVIAVFVALAGIGGVVYFGGRTRVEETKFALLYETGLAHVSADGWSYYQWDEIASVELKPETRNVANTVVFGHQFIVTPKEGDPVVIGVEFVGGIELGVVVMERASEAGAACTGYAQLPG
jgi:phage FluMu protein Com